MRRHGAIVVRGGTKRDIAMLRDDIKDAMEQGYGPVLSTFADNTRDGESRQETIHRICASSDIPHGKIQVSTVQTLTDAGLPPTPHVEEDWPEMHCHVTFGIPISDRQIQGFVEAFDEPIANPTGGKKTR